MFYFEVLIKENHAAFDDSQDPGMLLPSFFFSSTTYLFERSEFLIDTPHKKKSAHQAFESTIILGSRTCTRYELVKIIPVAWAIASVHPPTDSCCSNDS